MDATFITSAIMPNRTDWLALLTTANTLFFCLAGIYALKTPPKPKQIASKVFYYSAYLSQSFLFTVLVSLLIFILTCLIKSSIALIIIGTLFNFILVMLIFANSIVLYKYRFSLNMDIFRLVFGKGGSEVVQVHLLEYLIFGSAFVIILALTVGIELVTLQLTSDINIILSAKYMCYILAAIYLVNHAAYIFLSIKGSINILQYSIKIYLYHALSPCHLLKYFNIIKDKLYQAVNNKYDMQYPLKSLQNSKHKPLNVMLIVIDSLRFDLLTPNIMPNLYKFSKDASKFSQHFSGGNTTQPGIFSIFYGLPATYWKATIKQSIAPAMLSCMQQQNYQLAIYASATLENPSFHKNIFCSLKNLTTYTNGNTPLERDKKITDSMIKFIHERNNKQPFFGFLFYDAPHGYYATPELPKHFQPTKSMNHITVNNNTDPEPLKNLYLCAVYETDKLIGNILESLQNQHLLQDTIVMITSDHGQEFNDLKKNYWEHPSNFARFQTKVPLIIHHPNKTPKEYKHLTTHYDIAPTIMQDALGIINPINDYSVGNHLYQISEVPFAVMANYTNYAVMQHNHIIEIQKSGCYQIMDHNMNYKNDPKIDVQTLERITEQILRYTTKKLKCRASTF